MLTFWKQEGNRMRALVILEGKGILEKVDIRRGRVGSGLHVVATPIGNMGDISMRAVETLRTVSLIACEDTRVTGQLLKRLGISVPMVSYHEHNADRMRPRLLARLVSGEAVALVSDAGTPLLSDPGFKLVRSARESGVPVIAVPGASALLTALVASGLPMERFFFAGFLPSKDKARRDFVASLRSVPATLVFYESARRLAGSLAILAEALGADREVAVCRELTKLHEEVRRGSLTGMAACYAEEGPPRGEIVIVVAPEGKDRVPEATEVETILRDALAQKSVREAAAEVAEVTGLSRRDLYAMALGMVGRSGGDSQDGT